MTCVLAACVDTGVATQLPGDALVPGTGYNATGTLSCAFEQSLSYRECPFGVMRRGGGNATLVITLPNLSRREILFEGGRPVSSNSPQSVVGEFRNDAVVVSIGRAEKYNVFNAVLFGG